MSAANFSSAAFAAAFVDAELSANGRGRDIGLKLFVCDFVFLDVAAAMGAGVRERGLENFVDGLRRRRGPMSVRAMLLAGFATGLFGSLFGLAFGEGGGLPFAGARLRFELLLEGGQEFLEFGDAALELLAFRACRARLVHEGKL